MNTSFMFHRPAKLLVVGGLLFAGLLAGQSAVAQIAGTKHDLSSGGGGTLKGTTTEICVFCHTPHGATTSAPLWNRNVPAASLYTAYSSASMDSAKPTTVSAGSGLCLSCHDGVTAVDNVINKPGNGFIGSIWGAGTKVITGAGNIGGGAADLSNDHPIGIPYCAGFDGSGACIDGDFKLGALYKNGVVSTAATRLVAMVSTDKWWIDTGALGNSGARDKADLLLYPDATSNKPSVECATCHEPHSTGSYALGTSVGFLRFKNDASVMCTSCHSK